MFFKNISKSTQNIKISDVFSIKKNLHQHEGMMEERRSNECPSEEHAQDCHVIYHKFHGKYNYNRDKTNSYKANSL